MIQGAACNRADQARVPAPNPRSLGWVTALRASASSPARWHYPQATEHRTSAQVSWPHPGPRALTSAVGQRPGPHRPSHKPRLHFQGLGLRACCRLVGDKQPSPGPRRWELGNQREQSRHPASRGAGSPVRSRSGARPHLSLFSPASSGPTAQALGPEETWFATPPDDLTRGPLCRRLGAGGSWA